MIKFKETEEKDIKLIIEYIEKIAKYEKLLDKVSNNEELLKKNIFQKKYAKIVLILNENNKTIGYLVYYFNYSTFTGKPGLYIEDLYLDEEERNKGYGTIIFNEIKKIAKDNKCGRIEWVCLNWNTNSLNFYKKMHAESLNEWILLRLSEQNF